MLNEITLEQRTLVVRKRISQSLAEHFATPAQVEMYLDDLTTDMILSVTQAIASQPLRIEEVTYPVDWWQAFKDRWFPRWLRDRFPVRYVTTVIRADAVYPEIALPNSNTAVVLYKQSSKWTEEP